MADSSSVEDFLVLCLSDSNLPTGGFVASSGLESFTTHGFASSKTTPPEKALLYFVQQSVLSYAQLVLGFIRDAWQATAFVNTTTTGDPSTSSSALDACIERICELDTLHHASLTSEVARRASKAQGAALLGLYTRSFASQSQKAEDVLLSRLKQSALNPRSGYESHLPICWAVLCAALGISLEKTQHLHLFLHARSILSAAIRLNLVGPYLAHRILAMDVKPALDHALRSAGHKTTGALAQVSSQSSFQDWLTAEKQVRGDQQEEGQKEEGAMPGPATTWPLQDIVLARHDSLHSRIFNS